MSLFLGSPKTGTFVVPKFWTFLSFSNQVYFENVKKKYYSPQKKLSNGV
jgi:hypothetical protein